MRPESRASSVWDWLKINLGLVGWPGGWPGGVPWGGGLVVRLGPELALSHQESGVEATHSRPVLERGGGVQAVS